MIQPCDFINELLTDELKTKISLYNRTVALAIKNSDSVPIAETSGELFIIVFIRDIGNCSVPISQVLVTFSAAILTKIK